MSDSAPDPAPTDYLVHVNQRGEVEECVRCDDTTIRAIVDAVLRNERHRASLANLRESQKYRRKMRKAVTA